MGQQAENSQVTDNSTPATADAGAPKGAPAVGEPKSSETPKGSKAEPAEHPTGDAADKTEDAGEAPKPTDKKQPFISPPKMQPPPETKGTTPDGKTGEPAPKPTESKVPEKYELQLSKQSPLEKTHLAEFERYGKEKNLSNAELQVLVAQREAELNQEIDRRSQSWLSDIANDPEIGGERYEETLDMANRGVDLLDTDGKLRAELDRFGYGNHPEIVRAFAKVGRQNQSGRFRMGQTGSAPAAGSKPAKSVLYGGTK